jgi:hypothetical protein
MVINLKRKIALIFFTEKKRVKKFCRQQTKMNMHDLFAFYKYLYVHLKIRLIMSFMRLRSFRYVYYVYYIIEN